MTKVYNRTAEKIKRKTLRQNMSQAEIMLWSKLKGKGLCGYKFRRQYSVGKFVIDFYCPKLKLAIEADGDSHYTEGAESYDRERQVIIESFGITFLRFTNRDIYENLEGVLYKILQYIDEYTSPIPSLVRRGERGGPQAGFTLVELIITIVLIGIIAGVAAMLILQGVRGYSDEEVRAGLTNQARLGIERMVREIRTIRQAGDVGTAVIGTITGNPTNSLIFTDISGSTISYSLSGSMLNRTVGLTTNALAESVSTLEFRHFDSSNNPTTTATSVRQIQIDLTVARSGETQSFRIRVYLRNFS